MSNWRDYYQGWAGQPAAVHSTGAPADPLHFQRIGDHIARRLQLEAGRDRVLDVGCASGLLSQQVAPHCRRLIGVDFIEDLVRLGMANNRTGNSVYLCAEAGKLPMRTTGFDKVYCYNVISHVPDAGYAVGCVRECLRVVKPRGCVYIGNVVDRRRRLHFVWRTLGSKAPVGARLRTVASVLLPEGLKTLLRGGAPANERRILWFHPRTFQRLAAELGWECVIAAQQAGLHDSWYRFDVVFRPRA